MNCREAARAMIQVAQAMEYAHQHGVIHRDIKPSNIIIDPSGIRRVSDFGLAKLSGPGQDNLTLSGQILGTPAYMSPEQASGQTHLSSVTTDVHSLGAVFYRCICGRPPFVAVSTPALLVAICQSEPNPPSHYSNGIDKDADTICLKCLEKEPARRYQSAIELSRELERYLRGDPIHARQISPLRRLARYARRRPAEMGLAIAAILVVCLGTFLASQWWSGSIRSWRNLGHADLGSRSEMFVWLALLGPIFTVSQAIGPQRLRKSEEILLRCVPEFTELFLFFLAWVGLFS
jgi:serine/threonine-protein kinase